MPQLDALRAFAVANVVAHHVTLYKWAYGAAAGVHLFFVLSGFLITGILLKARDEVAVGQRQPLKALRRFYARRFLRIFPLYYFVIGVGVLLNITPFRSTIGWLLTYTLNIKMAGQGWFEENIAHLWSLSVEEQFYIFWPWLIMFLPRRYLKPAIIVVIASAVVLRLSYVLSGFTNMSGIATYMSTVTALDSLGCGALLALISAKRGGLQGVSRPLLGAIAALAVAVAVLCVLDWNRGLVIHDTAAAVFFTCVVAFVAPGIGGVFGKILLWPPLLYLGKISYGIYVYHPFVPLMTNAAARVMHVPLQQYSWQGAAVNVVVTVALSSLSWFLLEKPINDLKRYFA